jgi:hypothetical protein
LAVNKVTWAQVGREIDHFGNCPVCGALIDMRDLGQILLHLHDAEIEIGEGSEPPGRDHSKRC